MLEEEELKNAALLVFANKQVFFLSPGPPDTPLLQDMPNAMSAAEVSQALGLASLKNRQWSIQKTSAVKGEGLTEGLDWYLHPTPSLHPLS